MSGLGRRWDPWIHHPGTAGIMTDFDGTLAPIVDDPGEAKPVAGAAEVLARLVLRFPMVAVISGRPVAYLATHLGDVAGLILSGLYGAEHQVIGRGEVVLDPRVAPFREVMARVADEAERRAPTGVNVERKGSSVGLHTRNAPDAARWVTEFAARQAASNGLWAHAGKMSVELVAPVELDKGHVVARLSQGLAAAAYFGDDLGDLPAFEALLALRASGCRTLAVAVAGPEAPPEVLAAADEVIAGPDALGTILALLAGPDDS